MAKLAGTILFTGTIGDLTAYKRHDSDGIIVREKGGPGKKRILTHENFDMVRRNMVEFGGRNRGVRWLREATRPVHLSGDTKFTSRMVQMMKAIQVKDTTSELGKRGIPFSAFPKLFEGFNLNRHNNLDTIIRNPIHCAIAEDKLTARVSLPALMAGINFNMPFTHPYFKITVSLGLLPNLEYGKDGYLPVGYIDSYQHLTSMETEWHPALKGMAAQEMVLQLPTDKIPAVYTLVLSAGIIAGKVTEADNGIRPVKYVGAVKILAME